MESFDGHIQQIIKADDDNKLAIFVGAGVSMSSSASSVKLPSWNDLIHELKKDLKIQNENDYLKIAQLYFLEFGEVAYYNKIKEYFPDSIEPSYIHDLLLDIDPQCIISTNWDLLFEKAIENKATLHEVICSDKDLVKSVSMKKVIKMHGDFKNHNIVFKEDDYLNYSYNFPLLENYVKSILSTHTVLFLGYSYNDINLKQIMKWIQNHSSYTPSMYLVSFQDSSSQKQYLENHGIKTLLLNKIDTTNKSKNAHFEDSDWRSLSLSNFLERIKYKHADKGTSNQDVKPAELIYQRLKHLESLDYISLQQVLVSLSNCGYEYNNESQPILNLYPEKGVVTKNYNEELRQCYQKFKNTLIEGIENENEFIENDTTLNKVFKILSKASIAGVITNENDNGKKTYFINSLLLNQEKRQEEHREWLIGTTEEKAINKNKIDDLSLLSYQLFKEKKYEESFNINSDIILLCKKQKNYSQLLIALFNKNILVWNLKYSFSSDNRNTHSNIDEVDIQEQFFSLPKSELKKLQPLYDFVSLKRIYEISYNSSNELNKINEAAKSIKNGGMHFNNYADKPSAEHVDLLMFTAVNKLMVNHEVYNTAIQNFVKISIARQSLQKNIKFNIYEIFSCVNFFVHKDLKIELGILLTKDSNKKLLVHIEDKAWLIENLLPYNIEKFIRKSSYFKKPERETQNIIMLLSLIELTDDDVSLILGEFEKLISSNQNTINTYESINMFLANQHNIYKKTIKSEMLIKIIDNLISKVVYRNANGWDIHAITNNSLLSLYGLVEINKSIYTNAKLINMLIAELNDSEIKDQINFSQTLLLSIFKIGNKPVQEVISSFVQDIHKGIKLDSDSEFNFYFWSFAVDFTDKIDPKAIEKLKAHLEKLENENVFHSSFYGLKNVIDYLVDKKETQDLEEVQSMLNNTITLHDSRPLPSNL